jgi:HSP20 family protein
MRLSISQRTGSGDWVEKGFGSAMFDNFIPRGFFSPSFIDTGVSTPAVNIIETSDDFRLEMVAPGMKKENFNVAVQEGIITISYDHEDNREGARDGLEYRTREYNYHSFVRSFSLPEIIETEQIQAKYEDGILNIVIPKKEHAKGRPVRQITIS